METYVKRFHEKALDCYDLLAEEVFVECMPIWHAKIIKFSSLSRLIEATRCTNNQSKRHQGLDPLSIYFAG